MPPRPSATVTATVTDSDTETGTETDTDGTPHAGLRCGPPSSSSALGRCGDLERGRCVGRYPERRPSGLLTPAGSAAPRTAELQLGIGSLWVSGAWSVRRTVPGTPAFWASAASRRRCPASPEQRGHVGDEGEVTTLLGRAAAYLRASSTHPGCAPRGLPSTRIVRIALRTGRSMEGTMACMARPGLRAGALGLGRWSRPGLQGRDSEPGGDLVGKAHPAALQFSAGSETATADGGRDARHHDHRIHGWRSFQVMARISSKRCKVVIAFPRGTAPERQRTRR